MATLFQLGSRGYHATVNEFQGKILIHIRKHTDFPDAEKVPTRFGIALTVEEFEELKNTIPDLNDMAVRAIKIENHPMTYLDTYRINQRAVLLKLGPRGYHATVQKFKNDTRIHIRKYIEMDAHKYELVFQTTIDPDGTKIPTKQGVALSIEEFQELKKVIPKLSEIIETMQDTSSVPSEEKTQDTKLPENKCPKKHHTIQKDFMDAKKMSHLGKNFASFDYLLVNFVYNLNKSF